MFTDISESVLLYFRFRWLKGAVCKIYKICPHLDHLARLQNSPFPGHSCVLIYMHVSSRIIL